MRKTEQRKKSFPGEFSFLFPCVTKKKWCENDLVILQHRFVILIFISFIFKIQEIFFFPKECKKLKKNNNFVWLICCKKSNKRVHTKKQP